MLLKASGYLQERCKPDKMISVADLTVATKKACLRMSRCMSIYAFSECLSMAQCLSVLVCLTVSECLRVLVCFPSLAFIMQAFEGDNKNSTHSMEVTMKAAGMHWKAGLKVP